MEYGRALLSLREDLCPCLHRPSSSSREIRSVKSKSPIKTLYHIPVQIFLCESQHTASSSISDDCRSKQLSRVCLWSRSELLHARSSCGGSSFGLTITLFIHISLAYSRRISLFCERCDRIRDKNHANYCCIGVHLPTRPLICPQSTTTVPNSKPLTAPTLTKRVSSHLDFKGLSKGQI